MGQSYTCTCKLEKPTTLNEEVAAVRHKIIYSKEALTNEEADVLGNFIARHDPYFNVPNTTFSEEEILNRLQILDFPVEYKESTSDFFKRNPESLARLKNYFDNPARHRYLAEAASSSDHRKLSTPVFGSTSDQQQTSGTTQQQQSSTPTMQTVTRHYSSPIPIPGTTVTEIASPAVCHPFPVAFPYPTYPVVYAPPVIPTAVTTHTYEPRTFAYTSYTPITRYTTQYLPMTTASTQYAPQTQYFTTYQPASYTTYGPVTTPWPMQTIVTYP